MSLQAISDHLADIATILRAFYVRQYGKPATPQPPTRIPLSERQGDPNVDIQQFQLKLGPLADVVTREVVLTIDAEAALPAGLPPVQTRTVDGGGEALTPNSLDPGRDIANQGAFEVPENAAFTVRTTAIDDAGNTSEATHEFVATDQVPPDAPDAPAVQALAEREAADDDGQPAINTAPDDTGAAEGNGTDSEAGDQPEGE